MKNAKNKSSSSAVKTGYDDEIIGAALSRGLVKSAATHSGDGECPSLEDMAAVIEGHVPTREKDRVLKHISCCADCYESFLMAVELYENEEKIINWEEKEPIENIISQKPVPKIFYWRSMALAASLLIMAFSIYLFFRSDELPKTPKELLEKSETLKDYQVPESLHEFSEKPFQAKAKIKNESLPLPPPPAKTQPEESKIMETTVSASPTPEPMERQREEMETEAPAGGLKLEGTAKDAKEEAPSLLSSPRSSTAKTKQMEMDNEVRVDSSDEDAWQDKKNIPIQQQALILNQQVQAVNNYISREELTGLFTKAIILARQIGKEFVQLRQEAVTNRDFTKLNSYINGLKPLMTVKGAADRAYIYPDVDWFLSRSEPGTVEHSFFALARSGWCAAADLCNTGKTDRSEAQKLLAQWQALEPQLTGIFKQVALYTIARLGALLQ